MPPAHESAGGLDSLYLVKCLGALAVVAIHAPLGRYQEFVNEGAALAVPLFLMITGYFLYRPEPSTLAVRLGHSIRRLVPWLLVTQLVYTFLPRGVPSLDRGADFALRWLFVGINSNEMHLWYLSALIESLGLLYLATRLGGRWGLRLFLGLGFVALLAHPYLSGFVFTASWMDYWQAWWGYWLRYVLATGCGYLALGMLVRWAEPALKRLRALGWVALVALVMIYVNHYWLAHTAEVASILLEPWIRLLALVSLFAFCLQRPHLGRGTIASYVGRELSAGIYFWHILVLWGVSKLLHPTSYHQWGYLLTVLGSLLLSQCISWLQRFVRARRSNW